MVNDYIFFFNAPVFHDQTPQPQLSVCTLSVTLRVFTDRFTIHTVLETFTPQNVLFMPSEAQVSQ